MGLVVCGCGGCFRSYLRNESSLPLSASSLASVTRVQSRPTRSPLGIPSIFSNTILSVLFGAEQHHQIHKSYVRSYQPFFVPNSPNACSSMPLHENLIARPCPRSGTTHDQNTTPKVQLHVASSSSLSPSNPSPSPPPPLFLTLIALILKAPLQLQT